MKKYLLTILLFIFYHVIYAQNYFQRTYGDSSWQSGYRILLLKNKQFALLNFYSFNVNILVNDSAGNFLWSKDYSSTNQNYRIYNGSFNSINDTGFILILNVEDSMHDPHSCLIRINSTGDVEWTKGFMVYLNDVIQTSDGGFAMTGSAGPDPALTILKTDSIGNLEWSPAYMTYGSVGNSIRETQDGQYIVTGFMYSNLGSNAEVSLIKIDAIGNLIWLKSFGNNFDDFGSSVELTSYGGYVITGQAGDNDALFLMSTDTSGSISWMKTYKPDNFKKSYGYRVREASDSGLIAIGYSDSYSFCYCENDLYLMKTDNAGNVQWSRDYGSVKNDFGYDVIEVENGFITTGETNNLSAGNDDIYLMKLNIEGISSCNLIDSSYIEQSLNWNTNTPSYMNVGGAGLFTDTIIGININLLSHDACNCSPPNAHFTIYMHNDSVIFNDFSTWGETWSWDLGDGSTHSGVIPFWHAYLNQGVYNVCLTVSNSCGTDTYCDSVDFITKIENANSFDFNISISPNPFIDQTNIKLKSQKHENYSINIYDSYGIIVKSMARINSNEIILERGGLKSGVYILKIYEGDLLRKSGKLVIMD